MSVRKVRSRNRGRNKKGQGITEYGAIIAFVALLIALCFGFTSGSLSAGISAAFSALKANMNNASSAAAAAS